jgi:predicted transcriptional regulator
MRVGANELKLLQFITEHGPMTVREAAERFGRDQEIGLTTVQQMMERLRKKQLLDRDHREGAWVYRAVESRETMLKGVVQDFVERTLGGSLEPFALYLADRSAVSPEHLAEIREMVDRLSNQVEDEDGK